MNAIAARAKMNAIAGLFFGAGFWLLLLATIAFAATLGVGWVAVCALFGLASCAIGGALWTK